MLGEDETLAKNRFALICAYCRLINGQAPPGIRTLEDIGRWRCGSCGAWNGVEKVEHQVGRMVQEMKMKDEREGGDGRRTKVSRGDEDARGSPELMGGKEINEDEDEGRDAKSSRHAFKEVPDLADGSGSESGDGEKKEDEPVVERVAKAKRASRRTQK